MFQLTTQNPNPDPIVELLALQATNLHHNLQDKMIQAYMSFELGKATKLERITDRAGKRAYRRFQKFLQQTEGIGISE